MSYQFYSKEVHAQDWVLDNVSGTYSLTIPQTEHLQSGSIVVSAFESSISQGYKFVIGISEVLTNDDVIFKYNSPMEGLIIIRGK